MVYNYNAKILIIFSTPTYAPTFLCFILSYFLHRFYLSSVFQMITYLQKKIRQRKNTIRSVVSTTQKTPKQEPFLFRSFFVCKSINGSAEINPIRQHPAGSRTPLRPPVHTHKRFGCSGCSDSVSAGEVL